MRQLQFEYENPEVFRRDVKKVSQWCQSSVYSSVIFDIFTETLDYHKINTLCSIIKEELPEAVYRGCSTNGNIFNGGFSKGDTCVICTICEYPTTKIEVMQRKLTINTCEGVTNAVKEFVEHNPWVKAIELLVTIRGMSMTGFCESLSKIRSDIAIFGGGAFAPEFNENTAYIFSSAGECSDKSVVFLFIGGEDLNVYTTYITGWKPLGREFIVTKADKAILYELDGKPAYDAYYKYLNIKNDEHFFNNTLEFPFTYEHNGLNILRAPTASNPDGSLVMTSDVEQNVKARIAYGDPWTILNSVKQGGGRVQNFRPDVIHIYSCAARRTFWGSDAFKETLPFQSVAPTSGFYTSGEFLRTGEFVNQHNVTLVVAAIREGEAVANSERRFEMMEENFSGQVSMINRLATFIEAATEELEEANRKLVEVAVTDGLTQLYNRTEIQRQIKVSLQKYGADIALIMLDADNFKKVNDTYGHGEGDNVLKGLSQTIKNVVDETGVDGRCGRWGGEEFMLYLTGKSAKKAPEIAEKLRSEFAAVDFAEAGHQTVSLGTTHAVEGETVDSLCIRVDKALYQAKATGKNKVVTI